MTQMELLLKQLNSRDLDKQSEARLLLGTFYPNDYRNYLAAKLRAKGIELVSRLRQEAAA